MSIFIHVFEEWYDKTIMFVITSLLYFFYNACADVIYFISSIVKQDFHSSVLLRIG
jgi:hypothetical protein